MHTDAVQPLQFARSVYGTEAVRDYLHPALGLEVARVRNRLWSEWCWLSLDVQPRADITYASTIVANVENRNDEFQCNAVLVIDIHSGRIYTVIAVRSRINYIAHTSISVNSIEHWIRSLYPTQSTVYKVNKIYHESVNDLPVCRTTLQGDINIECWHYQKFEHEMVDYRAKEGMMYYVIPGESVPSTEQLRLDRDITWIVDCYNRSQLDMAAATSELSMTHYIWTLETCYRFRKTTIRCRRRGNRTSKMVILRRFRHEPGNHYTVDCHPQVVGTTVQNRLYQDCSGWWVYIDRSRLDIRFDYEQ